MYIGELIEKLNSKGITPKPSTIISYEPSTNAEIMISSNNMHMQTKKQV